MIIIVAGKTVRGVHIVVPSDEQQSSVASSSAPSGA